MWLANRMSDLLAGQGVFDRLEQVSRKERLLDDGVGAEREELDTRQQIPGRREEDHRDLAQRLARSKRLEDVDSAHAARQVEVEQHQIRNALRGEGDCAGTV